MPWNKSTKVAPKDRKKGFRINRSELEQEFIVSPYETATQFLKQKFPNFSDSTINSYVKHNAYNWVKRKKEFWLNHRIEPYITPEIKAKYSHLLTQFMNSTLILGQRYFEGITQREIGYREFLEILKFQKEVMGLNMGMDNAQENQVVIQIQKIENLPIGGGGNKNQWLDINIPEDVKKMLPNHLRKIIDKY